MRSYQLRQALRIPQFSDEIWSFVTLACLTMSKDCGKVQHHPVTCLPATPAGAESFRYHVCLCEKISDGRESVFETDLFQRLISCSEYFKQFAWVAEKFARKVSKNWGQWSEKPWTWQTSVNYRICQSETKLITCLTHCACSVFSKFA